jgi:hypothetical protein
MRKSASAALRSPTEMRSSRPEIANGVAVVTSFVTFSQFPARLSILILP